MPERIKKGAALTNPPYPKEESNKIGWDLFVVCHGKEFVRFEKLKNIVTMNNPKNPIFFFWVNRWTRELNSLSNEKYGPKNKKDKLKRDFEKRKKEDNKRN